MPPKRGTKRKAAVEEVESEASEVEDKSKAKVPLKKGTQQKAAMEEVESEASEAEDNKSKAKDVDSEVSEAEDKPKSKEKDKKLKEDNSADEKPKESKSAEERSKEDKSGDEKPKDSEEKSGEDRPKTEDSRFRTGMTKKELNQFTVKDLKGYLESKGFYGQGKKTVLVNRIFAYLQTGLEPKTPKRKARKTEGTAWMSRSERREMKTERESNARRHDFYSRGEGRVYRPLPPGPRGPRAHWGRIGKYVYYDPDLGYGPD